jgi:subtilisin family serine protease
LWKCVIILFFLVHGRFYASEEFLVKLPDNFYTTCKENRNKSLSQSDFISSYFNTSEPLQITAIDLKHEFLTGWHLLKTSENQTIDFNSLKNSGQILQYQKNNVFKFHALIPDDPLYEKQWYHSRVKAPASWEYYTSNKKIIIAVIDTGVDYLHADLQGSLWVNEIEDLNGNGQLDSLDLNNFDDDGNGYIDDVIGWDFTDAPRFPDDGDFRNPDNDPMDAYPGGHGTQIAGIISAQTNNGIGIAGLLPGCLVMNLRAGTTQGYLEEDDVARAILYAIENHAHIINMSFGDVVVSPFLEEVIAFAYDKGIVLVASAGNDGSDVIDYPAGFAQTISVGASNQENQRCSFSNWGQTLDLVAPGIEMLAPEPENDYREVQGTSFSAPVVSAAAALVLSKEISYNNEQVRNLVKSSATDLGVFGWDEYYGAGLVDMYAIARNQGRAMLRIHSPLSGSSTAEAGIPLIITVQNADLANLRVSTGLGKNPSQWQVLLDGYRFQIIEDTLLMLNVSAVHDTTVIIRLEVKELSGSTSEVRSILNIDRTPAILTPIKTQRVLSDDHSAVLITFTTDDIASASLKFRSGDIADTFKSLNLPYQTQNHKILFEPDMGTGNIAYYFEVTNASGLISTSDLSSFVLGDEVISPLNMISTDRRLPAGYLLNSATDFNYNNQQELVISLYDQSFNYGPLQIFEFNGEGFEQRFNLNFTAIPRSWGDADGDGLRELLASYGSKSYLFEATSTTAFPEKIVWQDTTDFWASQITDLDQDGLGEILGRRDKEYILLETVGDNLFQHIFTFENPTSGENQLGPPTIVITDLDNDSFMELIFGDYDGDVIIYENNGDNHYIIRHQYKLPFPDATDYLIAGYFKVDERSSLLMGCHTEPSANYEHEFDAQYWHYEHLIAEGDNRYIVEQKFNIYEYFSTKQFASGMGTVTLTVPGIQDLLIAPFPNLYVFRYMEGNLHPIGYFHGVRTNTLVSCDLDRDGSQEIYFNNGTEIVGLRTTENNRPVAPIGFCALPEDSNAVQLGWRYVSGASYYRIFKGITPEQLILCDSTAFNLYQDNEIILDSLYYYAIQTVDPSYQIPLSLLSQIQAAKANYPPRLDRLQVAAPNKLQLYFSEQMDRQSLQSQNFTLQTDVPKVISAISLQNDWGMLLSFSSDFQDGHNYVLEIDGIRDIDQTEIDQRDRLVPFSFYAEGEKPYLKSWDILKPGMLILRFSVPMDTATTLNCDNYTLEPSGSVTDVRSVNVTHSEFEVEMDDRVYLGSTGI